MLLYIDATGSTDGRSPTDIESEPSATHSERLLDRVKEVARGIESRVRLAINPRESPVTQLRVLVVDDHPDAADSLAAVLELVGPARLLRRSIGARCGAEFEPHVCLLDLMMPEMDGLNRGSLKARSGSRPLLLIATTASNGTCERERRSPASPSPHQTHRHPDARRRDHSPRRTHRPTTTTNPGALDSTRYRPHGRVSGARHITRSSAVWRRPVKNSLCSAGRLWIVAGRTPCSRRNSARSQPRDSRSHESRSSPYSRR